jgi:hypothetical protein
MFGWVRNTKTYDSRQPEMGYWISGEILAFECWYPSWILEIPEYK